MSVVNREKFTDNKTFHKNGHSLSPANCRSENSCVIHDSMQWNGYKLSAKMVLLKYLHKEADRI